MTRIAFSFDSGYSLKYPHLSLLLLFILCNSNYHNLIIPYFPVTFHIAADVAATVLTF